MLLVWKSAGQAGLYPYGGRASIRDKRSLTRTETLFIIMGLKLVRAGLKGAEEPAKMIAATQLPQMVSGSQQSYSK